MTYVRPLRCPRQFTEEQFLRMRWFLANASVLQPLLINPEVIASNTSVTWSTSQNKSANIEIETGATLTIASDVTMMPGTYVIVKRGGTLNITSAGSITSACGMWGGVIVEGTSDEAQELPYQGKVTLDGVIEHAVRGIGVHGLNEKDPNLTGGIVEAEGIIRNCATGIQFNRYRDSESGVSLPNESYLYFCRFFLDNNYRGEQKPVCLRLNDITDLSIRASFFRDNRTEGCSGRSSRADGILAEDATFKVKPLCHFLNLDHGIRASTFPLDNGGYEVRGSTFENCYTAIESSLFDAITILENNFDLERPEACPFVQTEPIVGVFLMSHTEGLVFAENNFAGINNNQDDTYIGTDCLGLGTMENEIRENVFSDLDFANRASGGNGGSEGLMYLCNTQTGNMFDIFVSSGGVVREVQGRVTLPGPVNISAGNTFTPSADIGFDNTNGTQVVTYFWNDDVEEENPDLYSVEPPTLDADPSGQANPDCGTGIDECLPCEENELDALKQQFFQERNSWQTKLAIYPTLTNVQAQQALQTEIDAHRSAMDRTGAPVLRNYLLDSTGVRPDSALTWLAHLRRYEADLRIARHHFFNGNFTAADQWLDDIPSRNELSTGQSDELSDMIGVLAVLQPHLNGGTAIDQLPNPALDSLKNWAFDCSEPGFVAKEVLRRNGLEVETECGGESKLSYSNLPARKLNGIQIFPNPSYGDLSVAFPTHIEFLNISVTTLNGQIVFTTTLQAAGDIYLPGLPPGIYLFSAVSDTGTRFNQKLILFR